MSFSENDSATLLLDDGMVFTGYSVGKKGTSGGEICFNTGMTGYQEIYTDPSYYGQIMVNTTPHIGNYGTNAQEGESENIKINGLVVNTFSKRFSRTTATESLQSFLEDNETVGISGLDTRILVKHIRNNGAMNAIISTELELDALREQLALIPPMKKLELSSKVTTKASYEIGKEHSGAKIAILDIGIKKSILKNFEIRNCHCKVFPAKTPWSLIKEWNPDGFFLSNGPGDPEVMDYAVHTVKNALQDNCPIFGICLGHQILAKAIGIKTYKMHHGHRGLNHPVKNLQKGINEITSQNHGFAVENNSLNHSAKAVITHINLNDNTVEGLRVKGKPAFSVQYHPESSPGPNDSTYLFDDFIQLIKENKQ